MTDLGQYNALQDSNKQNQVYKNKIREIKEYKELGKKIRALRQYIGSLDLSEDTIEEEAMLLLLKQKQMKLFKNI